MSSFFPDHILLLRITPTSPTSFVERKFKRTEKKKMRRCSRLLRDGMESGKVEIFASFRERRGVVGVFACVY